MRYAKPTVPKEPHPIDLAVDTIQSADFLTPEQKADILYKQCRSLLAIER